MFKQTFEHFNDTNLIVVGFMLFMLTFLGTFLWTYFVQDRKFYQNQGQKILKGDQ